ncbi:hypothetical protein Tco_1277591, partial [Tanacetum coccineum]
MTECDIRINQVEDLGPTIEDGKIIDELIEDVVKTRNNDNEISNGIDEYPSFCDYDRKIKDNFVTDFAVVENMDAYRDEDMGDIIIGKPFYKEVCVEARRFDGMITIYNGNDSLTYQMARSHP